MSDVCVCFFFGRRATQIPAAYNSQSKMFALDIDAAAGMAGKTLLENLLFLFNKFSLDCLRDVSLFALRSSIQLAIICLIEMFAKANCELVRFPIKLVYQKHNKCDINYVDAFITNLAV